jgi:hypothetical protein
MPVAAQQNPDAHQRGHKAGGDPGREQGVERNLGQLHPGGQRRRRRGLRMGEQGRGAGGGQGDQQHEDPPPLARGPLPGLACGVQHDARRRGWRGRGSGSPGHHQAPQHRGQAQTQAAPEAHPGPDRHAAAVQGRGGGGVTAAVVGVDAPVAACGATSAVVTGRQGRLQRACERGGNRAIALGGLAGETGEMDSHALDWAIIVPWVNSVLNQQLILIFRGLQATRSETGPKPPDFVARGRQAPVGGPGSGGKSLIHQALGLVVQGRQPDGRHRRAGALAQARCWTRSRSRA